MKLSRKFLNDYIDLNITTQELAQEMTKVGNEYDSVNKLIPATNLIIGEIKSCFNHPDSNHLHVCQVDIKSEILTIVCGAPNVRTGLKVIVAQVGAKLPAMTIKKGSIRGIESNGMLCSLAELGLENKYLIPSDINGIYELNHDAKIGEDPVKYLQLDDEIIDFELTANRGDLLSILGMAYECGAIFDKKVKDIDLSYQAINQSIDNLNLQVTTADCPLFLVKKAINITIKESPIFIKNRLIASGIRPINNVVDISNYVMLETGQPLHYYDAIKLGNNIVVRNAQEQEELITLDNVKRTLSKNDIVIASKDKVIGLAGVMGGLSTEIDGNTKEIIIEAAHFNNVKIRQTASKILRSEASNRFEKGLDKNRTYMAIERSCHLLEKYADASIVSGMIKHDDIKEIIKTIDITVTKINKVLGTNIAKSEIISIFKKLDFNPTSNQELITVTVPSRRMDINIKEDLIEEIGRIYGMDNIQGKLPKLALKPGRFNQTNRLIKNKMISLGLNETLSYTLISKDNIKKFTTDDFIRIEIALPMSEEHTTLRYSLLNSLLEIYEYNKAHKSKDICIFEMGNGFFKEGNEYKQELKIACLMTGNYYMGIKKEPVDFYIIKGVVEELLDYLGYKYTFESSCLVKELHPGQSANIIVNKQRIGIIGKIHPSICSDNVFVCEINLSKLLMINTSKMKYQEISKYPEVNKDLAFIVDKKITSEAIEKVIKRAGGKTLTKIAVFDVYEGEKVKENEKSLAYSLTFKDQNKTLNEEEITTIFNKIINEVQIKQPAKLRDK